MNIQCLASKEWTSNIKSNRAFERFTKLVIEQTRTSFFPTSNGLEHVHLLVIQLEHPIYGFEHVSTHHYNCWLVQKVFSSKLHFDIYPKIHLHTLCIFSTRNSVIVNGKRIYLVSIFCTRSSLCEPFHLIKRGLEFCSATQRIMPSTKIRQMR